MRRKILNLAILVVGGVLIFSLGKSILRIRRSGERLGELSLEVQTAEGENLGLKREVAERRSDEFLEKEARDKLQMVKPGERIVVLPDNARKDTETEESQKVTEEKVANWRRWMEVFGF